MLENKIIKTEQTLLSELLSIGKALELLKDLEAITLARTGMALAKDQRTFSNLLSDLMETCQVVHINAEWYDNSDYSAKNLVINIGYEILEYSSLDLLIAYEYYFSYLHNNIYMENNYSYLIMHEGKDLSYLEAEVVFSALAEEKRLELVAYYNSKTISGGK